MDKNIELRSSSPAEAERLLLASLSGDAKLRVDQAFRLSAAALADEPGEWPTQILARLQSDKSLAIQRVLQHVAESREGCWLKPIRAPLIASGGPIAKIINVGAPYDESRALIWSKDRRTITSFRNSSFRTWDLSSEREAHHLNLPIDWGRAAISDPPLRAVVMASQRQLLLVDLERATTEVIFTGSVIERVAISADGAWVVMTSVPPHWDYFKHDWNGPRTLRLFDLERRSCVRTWEAHRAFITDLALSEDGRLLATASRDQTVQLVDLAKARNLGSWRCAREVDAVALTPSGHRIAYVSSGGVLVVRRKGGDVVGRFTHCGAEPGCVALSKNGHRVVLAQGGDVSVVDLRRARRLGPFSGTQPYQNSLAVDDQANHAITGETGDQLVLWDLTKLKRAESSGDWTTGIWPSSEKALVHQDALSFWDLSSGTRTEFGPARHCEVTAAPTAGVWAVTRWSSNGGRIRIGKWGRKQTKLLVQSRDLSRDMLPNMHFSRNGKRLLVHIHKFGCRILNPANGRTVWQRRNLGLGVRPFLSPSGRYILSCSFSGQLEVVDLDTREMVQQLQLLPITGNVLFAEDDDCIFIPQGSETVRLNWKTSSSTVLCQGTPSSISDDARWLVTESISRKLTLWALPDQHRAATFTLDVPVLHTALSPDGRFLVAGDQRGGVHILRRED